MSNKMVISGDSTQWNQKTFDKASSSQVGEKCPCYVDEENGVKAKHFFTGYEYVILDEVVEGDAEMVEKLIKVGTDPTARLKCMDEDEWGRS